MKTYAVLGCALVMVLVSGCPFSPTPNPAAVLEGTWQVTFTDPGDLAGYDIKATFSSDGQLTTIEATAPTGGTASLAVDSATTTTVDGSNVTISIPSVGGARILDGTLSEDQNTITGTLSQSLQLPSGDLAVTLPGSDLTLTRNVG